MRRCIFALSRLARADLRDIYLYLGKQDERIADDVLDAIARKIEWLGQSGSEGVARNNLLAGLRMSRSGPYHIYFKVEGGRAQVLRIIHGRRNIQSAMFEASD